MKVFLPLTELIKKINCINENPSSKIREFQVETQCLASSLSTGCFGLVACLHGQNESVAHRVSLVSGTTGGISNPSSLQDFHKCSSLFSFRVANWWKLPLTSGAPSSSWLGVPPTSPRFWGMWSTRPAYSTCSHARWPSLSVSSVGAASSCLGTPTSPLQAWVRTMTRLVSVGPRLLQHDSVDRWVDCVLVRLLSTAVYFSLECWDETHNPCCCRGD